MRQAETANIAERRFQHVEQQSGVGDRAAERARRVLRVRDRDDALLRHEPDRGLHADDRSLGRRSRDRPVRLRAHRDRREVGGGPDRRPRGRAGGIEREVIRAAREAPAAAPAVDRAETAEISPLTQVGLAEDDRTRLPETVDDHRIVGNVRAHQRERPRGGLHGVVRGDVVLEQHRNAVQRPAHAATAPFRVTLAGDRDGVRVRLDHRAQHGIQFGDPVQVELRDLRRAHARARHGLL